MMLGASLLSWRHAYLWRKSTRGNLWPVSRRRRAAPATTGPAAAVISGAGVTPR
jgi:hypothetical protein